MKGACMTILEGHNIPELFHRQAENQKDRPCVSYKRNGVYSDVSWVDMQRMILSFAHNLKKAGLRKGDRVALFSPNRYEWWVADQAILAAGAVTVTIYATNSAEESLFILKNSSARFCITGGSEHFDKIKSVKRKAPALELIISIDPVEKARNVRSMPDMLEAGEKERNAIRAGIGRIRESDISTIIYTSGTTGNPKGVVLTHGNIVKDLFGTISDIREFFGPDDVFLSFLPLSHVLERTAGYLAPICYGAKVAFAEDVSRLLDSMVEVRPTALICVPRIYEKMHAGILTKVRSASLFKRILFAFCESTAAANLPYVCREEKRPLILSIRYRIAERLVFSKLKSLIGFNRLKGAISGGGPLSVNDAEFFIGMGIRILEGFGLTETAPITHFNRPGEIVIGSVGRPIGNTEVRISDDGEIMIRGDQVMKGYYRNSAATREAFTSDGFFRTGDIGRVDENNILYITGRKKDIIVTSGGKNIAPQNIENLLKLSPYIEQVAVIGDRRKFISALIVPDFRQLEKWAEQNRIKTDGTEKFIDDQRVIRLFEKEIEKMTMTCSRVEKVKKFTILPVEWSQKSGELTPSQKVKRHVIEEKYKEIIERMYSEGDV